MLPSQMQLPGVYRFLDSLGSQLEKLGIPIAQMDIRTLLQVAERETRLSDFGDSYHREGLEILFQSIEKDADLHFFGKLITRMVILNYLTLRLLFVEAQKLTPDVFRTNLNAPIIITGIPIRFPQLPPRTKVTAFDHFDLSCKTLYSTKPSPVYCIVGPLF